MQFADQVIDFSDEAPAFDQKDNAGGQTRPPAREY
jgi:hypothetical protein